MLVLPNHLLVLHVLANGFWEDLPNNLPRHVRLTACGYLDSPSCPYWGRMWCLPFSRHQKTSLIIINFQTWQWVALQWHWPSASSRAGCIPPGSMHLCTSSLLIVSPASSPFTVGNISLPQTVTGTSEDWERPLLAKAEAKQTLNILASSITCERQSSTASTMKRLFEMRPHKYAMVSAIGADIPRVQLLDLGSSQNLI